MKKPVRAPVRWPMRWIVVFSLWSCCALSPCPAQARTGPGGPLTISLALTCCGVPHHEPPFIPRHLPESTVAVEPDRGVVLMLIRLTH